MAKREGQRNSARFLAGVFGLLDFGRSVRLLALAIYVHPDSHARLQRQPVAKQYPGWSYLVGGFYT
jgi:hypothetical protein